MNFMTVEKTENPHNRRKKIFAGKPCENSYNFCVVSNGASLIPGIVRLRDAPYYLGMNKTFFREKVQPYLTRIPIDKKGIGFSRTELDSWIAYMQIAIGQPPKMSPPWENSEVITLNKKLFASAGLNKPAQRTVKQSSMKCKPTPADLDNLIRKTISSDSNK